MATIVTNQIITVYQQTKTVYESRDIKVNGNWNGIIIFFFYLINFKIHFQSSITFLSPIINILPFFCFFKEPETFVKAALGNTWAHSVNTSLWMDFCKHHPVVLRVNPTIPRNILKIIIKKSPVGPNKAIYFVVEARGVVEYRPFRDSDEGSDKDSDKDLNKDSDKGLERGLDEDSGERGAEEICDQSLNVVDNPYQSTTTTSNKRLVTDEYVYQIAMET